MSEVDKKLESEVKQTLRLSQPESDRISEIYNDFISCYNLHKKSYHYFDDAGLEDYINDSVKRWNGYLPPRNVEDWQAHTFMQETRNKVIAIASFIASQRMRAQLSARTKTKEVDKKFSKILESLYNWSMDQEQGDMKFLLETLEALIKGTVVVYEGYNYDLRKVKMVDDFNWDTGKAFYTEEERVENDNCFQKIIALEDFFIPNFYEFDLQKQDYIIVREYIGLNDFLNKYENYPNAKYVKSKSQFSGDEKEGNVFFFQYWQERATENSVEVLHYYNKRQDIYNIIANGIILTNIDNPILFHHKQYPFSKAVFEPMAFDFFYGKSLPQKIMSEQDLLNTFYNMSADRTLLALFPWFFSSLQDEIEEDYIGPAQRIQVSDPSKVREAQIGGIGSGDVSMMNMIKESINKSSVSPIHQGQSVGDTATAVLQARESGIQILGMFMNFLSYMIYEQSRQRISNLLQFYPKSRQKNSNGKFEIKKTILENEILGDGERGIRIIKLVGDKKEIPSVKEMEQESLKKKDELGEEVEITYLTPNMFNNIDFKVKIIPTSSIAETKSLKKAMTLEYANTLAANPQFAQMANWEGVFEIINDVFDMDFSKVKKTEEQMQTEAGQMQAQGQGRSELIAQMTGMQKPSMKQLLGMKR